MAREFVTKSARFYAVSLRPDICKTPVGKSMPPLPYTIKGEFSEAVGTARGVTSHDEQMAIAESTVIPTVTGDAPGTGKGIKSGTVGKQVKHDEHSKTVKFNGERAIREGDRVTMNDENTQGKIYERGGEPAKPRIGSIESATPSKTFSDRFDESMEGAANRVEQGKQWLGEKVGQFSQTTVGSKVMGGLQWLSEKTELTEVKEWKEGLARNVDDAAVGSSNKAVMAAGALTVAALEFIPTSLLDLVPGGGKSAGAANKIQRTLTTAERLSADASKAAHYGQQLTSSAKVAERVEVAAAKAESKVAAAGGGASKPPASGKPGGGGKGNGNGGSGKDGGKSKKRKAGPCDHLRQGNGKGPYRGGAHSKTSKPANDGKDSHHMPAKDVSPLSTGDGPAIQMDPKDHGRTSSNGQMAGSIEYRELLADMLSDGRWRDVMVQEIKDVRRVAAEAGDPRRYNEAMLEMLEYFKCLEQHGLVGK